MNRQEYAVLGTLLNQLVQARVAAKDAQADAMIRDATAQQADAAYLLVQKVLLLDRALSQAKAQIADLQDQLQSARPSSGSSFLDPSGTWGHSAAAVASPAAVSPPPMTSAAPALRPGFFSDGVRSTLGTIASTAAGVAGGALLFEGIENLMHHHGGNGFLGAPAVAALPSETTIVNNYYDGAAPSAALNDDAGLFDDGAGFDDGDGSSLI